MAAGLAAASDDVAETQRVVCFTETPLEHAWMINRPIPDRQMEFNGYGLAFTKAFARKHGCNPVWYLDMTPGNSRGDWLTRAVEDLVQEAGEAAWIDEEGVFVAPQLVEEPILKLTPFIEQMGTWPTTGTRKEFWWEREWRCVGDLRFDPDDIVVVFAPEAEHAAIKKELDRNAASLDSADGWSRVEDPTAQQFRRLVHSRVVDATWGLEYMIGTLAGMGDLGPFPRSD